MQLGRQSKLGKLRHRCWPLFAVCHHKWKKSARCSEKTFSYNICSLSLSLSLSLSRFPFLAFPFYLFSSPISCFCVCPSFDYHLISVSLSLPFPFRSLCTKYFLYILNPFLSLSLFHSLPLSSSPISLLWLSSPLCPVSFFLSLLSFFSSLSTLFLYPFSFNFLSFIFSLFHSVLCSLYYLHPFSLSLFLFSLSVSLSLSIFISLHLFLRLFSLRQNQSEQIGRYIGGWANF